jgi:hypothetical protein
MQLSTEEFVKRLPPIDVLISNYHVPQDAAFFLCRAQYSHSIQVREIRDTFVKHCRIQIAMTSHQLFCIDKVYMYPQTAGLKLLNAWASPFFLCVKLNFCYLNGLLGQNRFDELRRSDKKKDEQRKEGGSSSSSQSVSSKVSAGTWFTVLSNRKIKLPIYTQFNVVER